MPFLLGSVVVVIFVVVLGVEFGIVECVTV